MWVKLDDKVHHHRKVVAAQRLAGRLMSPKRERDAGIFGLWVLGLSWCNDNRTDGRVSAEQWRTLAGDQADALAEILVRVGLWELHQEVDEFGLESVGWAYHDYLVYQWSRAQLEARESREKRRKALSRNPALCAAIKSRDGDQCRYCEVVVSWTDKRSTSGATYDHLDPRGPNALDNVVVSCRGCNASKGERTVEEWATDGGRPLLPEPRAVAIQIGEGGHRSGHGSGGAPDLGRAGLNQTKYPDKSRSSTTPRPDERKSP